MYGTSNRTKGLWGHQIIWLSPCLEAVYCPAYHCFLYQNCGSWRLRLILTTLTPKKKVLSKCSLNSFTHSISVFWAPTMCQLHFWKLGGYHWAENDPYPFGVHLPGWGKRQYTVNRIHKCVIWCQEVMSAMGGWGEFGMGRGLEVLNRVVREGLPEKGAFKLILEG